MKIGIIVFSATGHTLEAAELLRKKLQENGHEATIDQIKISGEAASGKFQLTYSPETEAYETIIFASPVQAFSLNPVMKAYLNGLASLEGKQTAFLATKQLPFYWTGGNKTVAAMKKICKSKGAEVLDAGIVIWSAKERAKTLAGATDKIAGLFPAS